MSLEEALNRSGWQVNCYHFDPCSTAVGQKLIKTRTKRILLCFLLGVYGFPTFASKISIKYKNSLNSSFTTLKFFENSNSLKVFQNHFFCL